MAIPWGPIVDVGMGLLSMGGAGQANRANQRLAREQMRFQERMSSTAAQRAVGDYTAAGLNPALAYDRPASSPGGTMAMQQDAVGAGVSSAMAMREQRYQLQLMAEQSEKTRQERRSAEIAARIAGNTEEEVTKTAIARARQERDLMPYQRSLAETQADLAHMSKAEAQAMQEFFTKTGAMSPGVKMMVPLLQLLLRR